MLGRSEHDADPDRPLGRRHGGDPHPLHDAAPRERTQRFEQPRRQGRRRRRRHERLQRRRGRSTHRRSARVRPTRRTARPHLLGSLFALVERPRLLRQRPRGRVRACRARGVLDLGFTLDSTGAPAFSVGAEAIGVAPLALPIPGTDCLLLVDPLIAVPIGFDANGETRLIHSLPWDLAVDVRAQIFACDPSQLALRSSNGLRIDGVQ